MNLVVEHVQVTSSCFSVSKINTATTAARAECTAAGNAIADTVLDLVGANHNQSIVDADMASRGGWRRAANMERHNKYMTVVADEARKTPATEVAAASARRSRRFAATQRERARLLHKIMHHVDKLFGAAASPTDAPLNAPVVLLGMGGGRRATWRVRGHAVPPSHQKIARQLAHRGLVVLSVDEHFTSKLCPFCSHGVTIDKSTRLSTCSHAHCTNANKPQDRDRLACVNILRVFLGHLLTGKRPDEYTNGPVQE